MPTTPIHKMDDEKSVYLDREEHFHKGSVGGKLVVPYYYDANTDSLNPASQPGGLTPVTDFDYIEVTATTSTKDTLDYKLGGSGGTAVQSLVINYTSSSVSKISDTFDNLAYS